MSDVLLPSISQVDMGPAVEAGASVPGDINPHARPW